MANTIKRRGLSDVVTTVLIILLVLAAVAIIWGYLRGALEESGQQITGACLTLDLQPKACNFSGTGANTQATVRYGRDSGEGQLSNVTLIFDMADGTTKTFYPPAALIPKNLESFVYATTGAGVLGQNPTSFSVAGTVLTESGQVKLCPKTNTVQCTRSAP